MEKFPTRSQVGTPGFSEIFKNLSEVHDWQRFSSNQIAIIGQTVCIHRSLWNRLSAILVRNADENIAPSSQELQHLRRPDYHHHRTGNATPRRCIAIRGTGVSRQSCLPNWGHPLNALGPSQHYNNFWFKRALKSTLIMPRDASRCEILQPSTTIGYWFLAGMGLFCTNSLQTPSYFLGMWESNA